MYYTIFSSASNFRRVSCSIARFRLAGPKRTLVDLGRVVTATDGFAVGTVFVDSAIETLPFVTDLATTVTGADGAEETFTAVFDCTVAVVVDTDEAGAIGATLNKGRPVAGSTDVDVLEREPDEPAKKHTQLFSYTRYDRAARREFSQLNNVH